MPKMYFVVTNLKKTKEGMTLLLHKVATVNKYQVKSGFLKGTEAQIVTQLTAELNKVPGGTEVIKANFDIEKGKIKPVCAADKLNLQVTVTALAEVKNHRDTTLAYDCLISDMKAGAQIARLDVQKLIQLSQTFKAMNSGAFTNIMVVEGDYVRAYPGITIDSIVIDTRAKREPKKVVVPGVTAPAIESDLDGVPVKKSSFTKAQLKEIKSAEDAGCKDLVYNPELTPEQMFVIWKSKSTGSVAEAYNKPCYTAPVMKFYARHLKTKKDVADFGGCLANPKLTVPELEAIAKGMELGMDPNKLIGQPAAEIEYQANEKLGKLYCKTPTTIPDFISLVTDLDELAKYKSRRHA